MNTLESALQIALDVHRGAEGFGRDACGSAPLLIVGMAGRMENEMIVGFLRDVVKSVRF